jgi:large conductance mechanosensitive channel
MLKEFKAFIARGNVMDLAVGVIIGAAFQAIINSLVNDIIMPVITLITGGIDFTNWFISLDGTHYKTLADAQEAGAATLNYGVFITAVINFLLMALVIFFIVKAMNKLAEKAKRKEEKEKKKEEPTKSDEVVLLEQIRDLLKKENKKSTKTK